MFGIGLEDICYHYKQKYEMYLQRGAQNTNKLVNEFNVSIEIMEEFPEGLSYWRFGDMIIVLIVNS